MRKLILLLLLLPVISFAQQKVFEVPFITGNDTIFTTSSDSIDCRLGVAGLTQGYWETLSQVQAENDTAYVTLDDKTNDRTKVYILADETWWTWAQTIQFRIRAEDDTLTSKTMTIGGCDGAVTLFVQPISYGDATPDTILYKVRLGGN